MCVFSFLLFSILREIVLLAVVIIMIEPPKFIHLHMFLHYK